MHYIPVYRYITILYTAGGGVLAHGPEAFCRTCAYRNAYCVTTIRRKRCCHGLRLQTYAYATSRRKVDRSLAGHVYGVRLSLSVYDSLR